MSLKPCPFCGSDNIGMNIEQRSANQCSHFFMVCRNCGSKGAMSSIPRLIGADGKKRRFTEEEREKLKKNKRVIEACEEQWNRRGE